MQDTKKEMKELVFVCKPGLENFITPIIDGFNGMGVDSELVLVNSFEWIQKITKAKTVWIEWGDDIAQFLTTDPALLNGKKVILRIHSYEAFAPYIAYINWNRVSALIFVAEHIKDLVLHAVPKIEELLKDRIYIVPNGVDLDNFQFHQKQQNSNIAYVGYINFKKGPMALFTSFAHLVLSRPKTPYQLHIAGKFQEPRYKLYMHDYFKDLNISDRVIFHGWVPNIPAFLVDKSYIISSSVMESQGMGILEAMATGCKPLIHAFYGWRNVYPEKYIWHTPNDLVNLVEGDFVPNEYRKFVVDNYDFKDKLLALHKIYSDIQEQRTNGIGMVTQLHCTKPSAELSVCMMVKDEEKNIARCLNSVKDFADEIVVVDTGSTDKTIEICESFGAKVYSHPFDGEFIDDFSKYRNLSIGYSSKEWLIQIDADEEFVGNGKKLKAVLGNIPKGTNGVQVLLTDVIHNETDKIDGQGVTFTPIRIFRNGYIHYDGIVHNEPKVDGRIGFYKDAALKHYGYHGDPERKVRKSKRTIHLLHKRLETNLGDSKALFYLFQSYCDIGQIEKGLEFGERYLTTRLRAHDFNESVYYSMITAYMSLKNTDRAFQLLNEAHQIIPNDLDLCLAMIEYGVATNNGNMVMEGAHKYEIAYHYMQTVPTMAGLRFVYSNRPDSLAYVLHQAAMVYLQAGSLALDKLNKSLDNITDEETRNKIKEELEKNLKIVGLTPNT